MEQDPLISVLMPCFNCEAHLAEAIESILAQTMGDFELLLVNDGSTDATRAIIETYATDDERICVIDKANSGLVDSLNLGLMRARGKLIARMDGDDISLPHRFAKQLGLIQFGHCDAVSAGYLHINEAGDIMEVRIPARVHECDPNWLPAREPYLPHPFLLSDREAILSVGGYRAVHHSEDADLYWRLFFAEKKLWNIPDVLGKYRIHPASISSSTSANARIQSVYAQLAAISFRRRLARRPDLGFNLTLEEVRPHANAFESLIALYQDQLDEEEVRWIAAAASLKFLAASRLRNYAAETVDLDFAERKLSEVSDIDPANLDWAEALIARKRLHPNEKWDDPRPI